MGRLAGLVIGAGLSAVAIGTTGASANDTSAAVPYISAPAWSVVGMPLTVIAVAEAGGKL